jgi:uncharacterized protein YraI
MIVRRAILSATLAALALAAGIGQALAVPAVATGNVNVRSGPGTSHAIVDQLRPGQYVDVDFCQANWCFVQKPGPNGWVSANYLAPGGGAPPVYDPPPAYPPVYIPPQRYVPPPPPVYIPPPPPTHHWGSWRGHPQWDDPRPWQRRWPQSNSVCIGSPLGQLCVSD